MYQQYDQFRREEFGGRWTVHGVGAHGGHQNMSNHVHIVNQYNNQVIDVDRSKTEDGTQLLVYPKHSPATPNQQFRLENAGNNRFYIVSALNPNMVVEIPSKSGAKSGVKCQLHTKDQGLNQQWEWNGTTIHSALNRDLVLSSHGGDKGTLIVETKNNKSNQNWLQEREGRDEYGYRGNNQLGFGQGRYLGEPIRLINQNNQCAIDVDNSKTTNGTELLVYPRHSPAAPNQQWYLENVGNDKVMICSALNPNMVIDVPGAKTKSGTKCILYEKVVAKISCGNCKGTFSIRLWVIIWYLPNMVGNTVR